MSTYQDGESFASIVTGNNAVPITQMFAENSPLVDDSLYDYAPAYGLAYGEHPGVDLGMPVGTKLYSPVAGKVIQTGPSQYFDPEPVYIQGDDNREWIFGHMSSDAVKTGDRVKVGDYLGESGKPYYAGPHLHLEVREPASADNGQIVVDPLDVLTGIRGTVSGDTKHEKITGESFWHRIGYVSAGILCVSVGIGTVVFGSKNARSLAALAI